MDLQPQALLGVTWRRAVGDVPGEGEPQELVQRQGFGKPPLQAPLRFNPLKEADEVHSEVRPRSHRRPTRNKRGLVVRRTEHIGVPGERGLVQQLVEFLAEPVPQTRGRVRRARSTGISGVTSGVPSTLASSCTMGVL